MTDSAVPWDARPSATLLGRWPPPSSRASHAHTSGRGAATTACTHRRWRRTDTDYAAQFEELLAGREHFAQATPVRLHARTAMVIANHLIYPFRYANKDLPVTAARLKKKDGLRAELIRELGPEPMQGELDLGLDEFEEAHRGLAQIPTGTSLVIVAYACSMSEGIMRLEWGVADLRPDRYLQWHRHEPL